MQTNDPRHFSSPGPSRKKKGPPDQKKCRRKVTKASREERKQSVHCSRTAHSKQALTIKIERVNRRRGDPSSGVCGRQKFTANLGKVMGGNKPSTHKSFQPPLQPACSCLCCKTPRSLEQDSPESKRAEPGVKAASQPGDQFHHNLRASLLGLVLPTGAGAAWGGGRGQQARLRKARFGLGKEPLWSGRNCR